MYFRCKYIDRLLPYMLGYQMDKYVLIIQLEYRKDSFVVLSMLPFWLIEIFFTKFVRARYFWKLV